MNCDDVDREDLLLLLILIVLVAESEKPIKQLFFNEFELTLGRSGSLSLSSYSIRDSSERVTGWPLSVKVTRKSTHSINSGTGKLSDT